jgi:putative ABC transport system permease protein
MERWNSHNTPHFLELTPGTDLAQFKTKLNEFAEERYDDNWQAKRDRLELPADATVMEYALTPLADIHLDASVEWTKVSNPLYSYILGGIAMLILIIACINYITLALARSSGRAKEVGIRKASGAQRHQIALQFWGETQLLTVLAMVAGVGLAELVLPFFNDLADKALAIHYLQDIELLGAILGITLLTGLLAGSYPAAVLAKYNPVSALKGHRTFRFQPRLTKALLVVQYCLSIFLIISSLIMFRQMDYVSSKNIGYDKEQVLFIPTHKGWTEEGLQLMERFRNEVRSIPGVASVSGMAPAFTKGSNIYGFRVGEEFKDSFIYFVDEQFIETMGMKLVEGRNFSEDRPTDVKDAIIVNQALVESMGWESPVGEQLPWRRDNPSTVIGIVKDFHFESLEAPIKPMLFHMDPEHGGVSDIAVNIEAGEIAETLPQLEEKWAEVAPFTPFDYWFLDDAVSQQYSSYQKWLQIMGSSTFIAILIACLGLFGLTGITAINKTKEIGIRKVLGAGIRQIIFMLNKDVVKLIAISIVIAAPISGYVMQQWLTDFAYRIEIGPGIFLVSAAVAVVVAVLTVSYHSVKAAMVNPVESLRNE